MLRKNQKGFTLIEILAAITILGILSIITLLAYTKYIDISRDKAYKMLIQSTISAMDNYMMDHPTTEVITMEELYAGEYLERPSDPQNNAKTCNGKVRVQKIENENGIDQYDYKISMCCENFNYTYQDEGRVRVKDNYCRLLPYDITQIKEIKVLHVYPNKTYKDKLKDWMEKDKSDNETIGKGIIKVEPVYIVDFNNNPGKYMKEDSGDWKYDEIVFGFSDCNSGKDLSNAASLMVEEYLKDDMPVVFGHDTVIYSNNPSCGIHYNFNYLAKYVNVVLADALNSDPNRYSRIEIVREGVFTSYPWRIGFVGDKLTIQKSHVSNQVAFGDVWIIFPDKEGEYHKKIYLSTYKNNAFIQTGHTEGNATLVEKKILANTLFYMYAKKFIHD